MSTKNLLVLLVVLAVLAMAAYLTRSRTSVTVANAPAVGDAVLPDLDINQPRAITITGPGVTNRLVRTDDIWVVSSLYDYPADFARIREQLTGLLDLKVGQVMRADDATREDTGLDDAATIVTLLDGANAALATIRVGAARTAQSSAGGFGGYPDGQYIAVNEDSILVVARPLNGLIASPTEWIERQLLQVDANEIASISVVNGDEQYTIQNDTNQVLTLDGLGADETFEAASASQLKRALSYLSCQGVADPTLSDEAMALVEPATYTATLRDGRSYVVALGAETNNARYARFTVSGDEEHAHLQDWTYLIPGYAATSMTVARDTLVKPVETEEETEPEAVPEIQPEVVPVAVPEIDPNLVPVAVPEIDPEVEAQAAPEAEAAVESEQEEPEAETVPAAAPGGA